MGDRAAWSSSNGRFSEWELEGRFRRKNLRLPDDALSSVSGMCFDDECRAWISRWAAGGRGDAASAAVFAPALFERRRGGVDCERRGLNCEPTCGRTIMTTESKGRAIRESKIGR